ncbi:hypothetical protein CAC42_3591 [Sphaceloma murrayae]|uniref:Uncharacterized protein n=1 Tax=Sphaceloma murrayae TaxID=2082308 RepID=A0A2K1QSS2_9PEZI|nr:hypothetical protein CAC42_3591 [Sphaceloma murrayae]
MQKSSTFHNPTTPPSSTTLSPSPPPSSDQAPTRKKRSHTLSLSRFHRPAKSSSTALSPPASSTAAVPSLSSLPFRRHGHGHGHGHGTGPSNPHAHPPARSSLDAATAATGAVTSVAGAVSGSAIGGLSTIHSHTHSHSHSHSRSHDRRSGDARPSFEGSRDRSGRRRREWSGNVALGPVGNKEIGVLDVEREKRIGEQREEELGRALRALSRRAHGECRRVDDVYYELLSRRGALREAVGRLEGLYGMVEEGRGEFVGKTGEVERESKAVVEGWQGFGERESAVRGLLGRLEEARERGKRAEDRLGLLTDRVERWEREEVMRGKGRKWWLVFSGWAAVTAVVLLIGLLAWRGVPGGFDGVDEWGSGWRELIDMRSAGKDGVGIKLEIDEHWARQERERGKRWRGVLDEL